MRKLGLWLGAAIVLSWAGSAYADTNTLLPGQLSAGGYGAPSFRLTSLAGRLAYMTGGEGAVIFGHWLTVGVAGWGLSAPIINRTVSGASTNLNLFYGGAVLGITAANTRLWHPVIRVLLGGGSASYTSSEALGGARTNTTFFLIEPQLGAELNVTHWFRVALNAGYRFPTGANMDNFNDSDLRSIVADLALKFGSF